MTGCLETWRQVPKRFVSAIVGEVHMGTVGVRIKVCVGACMSDLYVFMLTLFACASTCTGACVYLSTGMYVQERFFIL